LNPSPHIVPRIESSLKHVRQAIYHLATPPALLFLGQGLTNFTWANLEPGRGTSASTSQVTGIFNVQHNVCLLHIFQSFFRNWLIQVFTFWAKSTHLYLAMTKFSISFWNNFYQQSIACIFLKRSEKDSVDLACISGHTVLSSFLIL
jgi:hypothetical protein